MRQELTKEQLGLLAEVRAYVESELALGTTVDPDDPQVQIACFYRICKKKVSLYAIMEEIEDALQERSAVRVADLREYAARFLLVAALAVIFISWLTLSVTQLEAPHYVVRASDWSNEERHATVRHVEGGKYVYSAPAPYHVTTGQLPDIYLRYPGLDEKPWLSATILEEGDRDWPTPLKP